MTEPSDMQDKCVETMTCSMESRHIQTNSSCTSRGTQYKQRYISGEAVTKDEASMTNYVKMQDAGVEMEPVIVFSQYTQSHVPVKSVGTQGSNNIQQSRPYAAVASPGRPPAVRHSPPTGYVGGPPSRRRDFLRRQQDNFYRPSFSYSPHDKG